VRHGRAKRDPSGRRWRIVSSRAGWAGAAAALSVALVACSSSATSPASSGSASGSSASAAKGSPINVGTIQTISGAFGQQILLPTMKAWGSWVNAHGGINGHPVNLYVLDDQTNPALALSETKELISQDHVVAIIGSSSVGAAQIVQYATSQGVPVIGGVTAQIALGRLSFPTSTSSEYLVKGYANTAKMAGLLKFGAFTCTESAACTENTNALRNIAPSFGDHVVSVVQVSSTAPDYTAPCLSMIRSGAQAVAFGTSPQIALQIIQTCAQQGATSSPVVNGGTALPSWASDKAIQGVKVYIVDDVWPFSQRSTAAQQQFFQAMQQYATQSLNSPEMGAYVQDGWAGMQMFAAAAKAAGIGPTSTPAEMVNALYQVKDETLGGLIGPVTYSKSDAMPLAKCYFATLLHGGAYTSPFGAAPICLN
jgi:branched-chain amino acid transport system substrate-binding protein